MFKVRYIYLLASVLLISSCGNSGKEEKSTTPLLDNLRQGADEEYLAAKDNIAKVRTVIDARCNQKLLSEINYKQTLNPEDFKKLISMNVSECENNVEFTQYYSEVLFAAIDKDPKLFYRTLSNPDLKDYKARTLEELENPVGDRVSANKTLIKVQQSIREIETRTPRRELDQELNRDLNRIINIRRE